MKTIKKILKVFVFAVGMLVAVWFFMPWKQVGEFAFSAVAKQMSAAGSPLTWGLVENTDWGFKVNDVFLGGGTKFSFKSVSFVPDLSASLLNFALTCHVFFVNGEAALALGKPMRLGDGRFTGMIFPKEMVLDQLRTDGDLAINGLVAVDPVQMKISRAEAAIKVAEAIEPNVEVMQAYLPLKKDAPGRWILRRAQASPQRREAKPAQ